MSVFVAVFWVLLASGCTVSTWKWLRVAQREHYQPGRVSTMAGIWLRARPVNAALAISAAGLFAVSFVFPLACIASILIATAFPWGLATFPKTTPLVLTARMKRLLVVSAALQVIGVLIAASLMPVAGVAVLLLQPIIADAALAVTRPLEMALAKRFVVDAQRRLGEVKPLVVAITGSYGKTTTKNYANRIISGAKRTLASPASFNNLLGLSKAVNDGLHPGIEVFIAEMGTYGPGEIRRLCQLFKPSIAAITTIGEAHLERMGSRETIVRAKSEILEGAETAVLNVDVGELAALADTGLGGKTVIRCSAETADGRDVAVIPDGDHWQIFLEGKACARIPAPSSGHGINLAIAVGIAVAVGIPNERIIDSLGGGLSQPAHRAEVTRSPNGTVVIDDTYNANPEGAAGALRTAAQLAGATGTVWTITPGMVELGRNQRMRNRAFAAAATRSPNMQLIVTGYVNRRDLLAGAADPVRVRAVKDRAAAQRLIQAEVRPGDVLLYENDLPSHYP